MFTTDDERDLLARVLEANGEPSPMSVIDDPARLIIALARIVTRQESRIRTLERRVSRLDEELP